MFQVCQTQTYPAQSTVVRTSDSSSVVVSHLEVLHFDLSQNLEVLTIYRCCVQSFGNVIEPQVFPQVDSGTWMFAYEVIVPIVWCSFIISPSKDFSSLSSLVLTLKDRTWRFLPLHGCRFSKALINQTRILTKTNDNIKLYTIKL